MNKGVQKYKESDLWKWKYLLIYSSTLGISPSSGCKALFWTHWKEKTKIYLIMKLEMGQYFNPSVQEFKMKSLKHNSGQLIIYRGIST